MLDRESQNDSASVQWSADGKSFIVTDQTQFEAVSIRNVMFLTWMHAAPTNPSRLFLLLHPSNSKPFQHISVIK
jgi:hypothetical protein